MKKQEFKDKVKGFAKKGEREIGELDDFLDKYLPSTWKGFLYGVLATISVYFIVLKPVACMFKKFTGN